MSGGKVKCQLFYVFFPNSSNLSTISMVAQEKKQKNVSFYVVCMYVRPKLTFVRFFFCFFFVHLPLRRNGHFHDFAREQVPQSARLTAGGGCPKLFGQCPNEQLYFFGGASLREGCKKIYTTLSIFRHAIKVNIALVPVRQDHVGRGFIFDHGCVPWAIRV